jgi:hypothetical protein
MRASLLCFAALLAAAPLGCGGGLAGEGKPASDRHILVDQFGYRPEDTKVAVIRSPRQGYDAADGFSPGHTYQLRREADDAVVQSGPIASWNGGAVQPSSGDAGWWFDFSSVTTAGRYYVYDLERGLRSPGFAIDRQVYKPVLKAAMRMYFYQRAGFAKRRPYAEACWTDEAAYLGRHQDSQARDVTDPDNPDKERDLSGGWFDAGDTNKYVSFAIQPVHQLLSAYQEHPAAFGDDFDIPESGNGIPDVLDEVKWETDWLKKMQYADGSAALKVGETVYATADPPSSDHNARYYVPGCTSATIAVAGMFAHAALLYGRLAPLAAEAAELKSRAVAAWNAYHRVPIKQTGCDSGVVHAGKADLSLVDQKSQAALAAIYLFAITADPAYGYYIEAHYRDLRPYRDFGWSRYNPEQGDALLFYTTLKNADPALRQTILADKLADARAGNQVYGFNPADDLYRNFLHEQQYHWGSNAVRAAYGTSNLDLANYQIGAADVAPYRLRAAETLHYFHGVNPFAKVYLSNMYAYGVASSVDEIFHTWFWPGTRWSDARKDRCGPAPGYVPGGPVARAVEAGVPASIAPPAGQPAQKAYRDWNGNHPEDSYVVNEPGIYYQSAYVKLLSNFAD